MTPSGGEDRAPVNPEPDALCVCGHVNDEHGPSGACDIEGCLCGCFEMEGDTE